MARVVCPGRGVDVQTGVAWPSGAAGGRLVPTQSIVPKSAYGFQGRSNTLQFVDLAVGLEVSQYRRLAVAVRLHAKNAWASTASAQVQLEGIGLDALSPGTSFVAAAPVFVGPSISNATVVPAVLMAQLTTVPFSRARLRLVFSQGTSTSAVSQTLSVSVDFLERPR